MATTGGSPEIMSDLTDSGRSSPRAALRWWHVHYWIAPAAEQGNQTLAVPIKAASHGSQTGQLSPQRTRQLLEPRWCLYVIASISILWTVGWAKAFLIPLALAVFLACCLAPLVRWLAWARVPRIVGAAMVVLILIGTVVMGTLSLRDDATALIEELPIVTRQLTNNVATAMNQPDSLLHRVKLALGLKRAVDFNPVNNVPVAPGAATPAQSALMEGGKRAISVISDAGVIAFLTYFLLASGKMWERKILNARWGTLPGRTITLQIMQEIRLQMQGYLSLVAVTNALLGILIWVAFSVLGIPHAEVWGVAAALLHVIPYVGSAVIAVGSGLVASVQFNSITEGLAVAGATLLMTTIVGMVITTWLAGRASHMNTTMVFVSLLFWGWLWGLSGLLLGTPITMAIKVICSRVEGLGWIDDLLGDDGPVSAVAKERRFAKVVMP